MPSVPTVAPRVAPSTVVIGLLIAFCAVLLAKWLAVAALVALALFVLVRWGLGPGRRARRPEPAAPVEIDSGADCSWCGLAGGHRDLRGELVRPRAVHVFR